MRFYVQVCRVDVINTVSCIYIHPVLITISAVQCLFVYKFSRKIWQKYSNSLLKLFPAVYWILCFWHVICMINCFIWTRKFPGQSYIVRTFSWLLSKCEQSRFLLSMHSPKGLLAMLFLIIFRFVSSFYVFCLYS